MRTWKVFIHFDMRDIIVIKQSIIAPPIIFPLIKDDVGMASYTNYFFVYNFLFSKLVLINHFRVAIIISSKKKKRVAIITNKIGLRNSYLTSIIYVLVLLRDFM